MTTSILGQTPRRLAPFAPSHPWDRNFFLLWAAFAWFGILAGFGPDIVKHVQTHAKPFPLIVHFHAAAFVGWLVLFTVQILLIRTKRLSIHRKLGFAMVGLAGVMMVLGPATALIADQGKIGTAEDDPGFLSIQFTDILAFVSLIGAAVIFRNRPSVHKRLVLLGTLYITDAGFGRWVFALGMTGTDVASFWGSLYLCTSALILGVGAYDLITRRRLLPAYVAGVIWIVLMQVTAVSLYNTPAWKAVAAGWIAAV